MAQQSERIQVRDVALRLARGGTGETVLFLHDATGAAGWPPFLEALARRFEVIAPEHPGYGGEEPPPWLDRVADLSNFYLDFLDTLDLRRVHLVGASLGGWIAAELATRDCARLATLTLVDPPGLRADGVAGIDSYVTNDEQTIRDLFHGKDAADAAVKRLLAPEAEDALLRNKMVTAKLTWQPRLFDPHLAKWLHRVAVPTLIAWGAEDRILPPALAEAWRRAIPNAKVAILPQCGHLPHLEKPGELAGLIADFIATKGVAP